LQANNNLKIWRLANRMGNNGNKLRRKKFLYVLWGGTEGI